MQTKILIFNGPGGAGKDTAQEFFKKTALFYGYKTAKTSMVTHVKTIAAAAGWKGGKDFGDRRFLSDLKLALERWDNSPYETTKDFIENTKADFIFVDAREPKDIDKLKADFEVITILIDREECRKSYGNVADDGVFNYTYDYVIENNGTLADLAASMETLFLEIR